MSPSEKLEKLSAALAQRSENLKATVARLTTQSKEILNARQG